MKKFMRFVFVAFICCGSFSLAASQVELSGRDVLSYDMDLYGLADVMRLNRHMDIELNANVDFETLFAHFNQNLLSAGWQLTWTEDTAGQLDSVIANYERGFNSLRIELKALEQGAYQLKAFRLY
ncbi:MAG: hypothetical protein R2880_03580 [Deinococcales bacterium]